MLLTLSKDETTRTKSYLVSFIRFDKSIDPEKLVHQICVDAHANPDRKRSRYIQRMTPVKSIRKTLSVDLEAFAREILKPHFHSGGGPKKVCHSTLSFISLGMSLRPANTVRYPACDEEQSKVRQR